MWELRATEKLAFACWLVTDINGHHSPLLVKGDPTVVSCNRYPHVEQDEIFDLPGVVSRKKQLIPFLATLIKELAAEGALPGPGGSSAPFRRRKK